VAALVRSATTRYHAYFESTTESVLPLRDAPQGLAAWKANFAAGAPSAR
jgi:hypothetical protein